MEVGCDYSPLMSRFNVHLSSYASIGDVILYNVEIIRHLLI